MVRSWWPRGLAVFSVPVPARGEHRGGAPRHIRWRRAWPTLAAVVVLAASMAPWPMEARAEGNLASRATRLEPLVMDIDLNFSVKEYQLETGQYYRWRIESDGGDEFFIKAPGLFRNAWIYKVVINKIEVKPMGGIEGIEFDGPGIADIWFIPISLGNYDYFVEGYQTRGMIGTFVVR